MQTLDASPASFYYNNGRRTIIFGKDSTIQNFIKEHSVAVICSVDKDGQPHSSTIYYVEIDSKLYFMTKTMTEKFRNFTHNNRAALTIYTTAEMKAVNLTGQVRPIEDSEKHDKILQEITLQMQSITGDFTPIVKLQRGSFVTYEFVPTDAHYADFSQSIGEVEEKSISYD